MNTKQNISDWLERLQQESWNLELLISGFSIFLLAQVPEQLDNAVIYLRLHFHIEGQMEGVVFTSWGILTLSCYALIVSLVFHILIRGFWIGTIGLRSVQSKVDFERLRYAPIFENRLKENLSSLDRLLIRLDQISSAVFSFAFLIIFMLISLLCWFSSVSLYVLIIKSLYDFLGEGSFYNIIRIIGIAIFFVYLFVSLLYAIDTLFVGVIKRWKRTSKVYNWIYSILSAVTFSFLYRSIYYHLVSYIGIWQSRALFNVFVLGMILLPFFKYEHEIFFPDNNPKNETNSNRYDDMRTSEELIWSASIPSSVIKDNSLPIFIKYNASNNSTLLHLCDYEPSKKQGLISGIRTKNGLYMGDPDIDESAPDSLLRCLANLYEVKIDDSLYQDMTYYYLEHPNHGEKGIYTVLDLQNHPRGHHLLDLSYKVWREKGDTIVVRNWVSIPFWKE
ncbi:MAG: hypothetical protein AAF806_27590 [Bacteroidota bacterium]